MMRSTEIVGDTVTFIEIEDGKIIYREVQKYRTEAEASAAAASYLIEYTDFLPFGDEDEHNS
jgi:hypothetical protein